MKYKLADKRVELRGERHFIAPGAAVIGDVVMEPGVSIWFNAVVRGDGDRITLGANTNVQDGAVLHVDPGFPLQCGRDVTIGHKAMLHGCSIGNNTLIGINAVILNGAKIGNNCIVGANALVTEGTVVPDGSMVLGAPAKVKKPLSEEQIETLALSAKLYAEKAQYYLDRLEVDDEAGK